MSTSQVQAAKRQAYAAKLMKAGKSVLEVRNMVRDRFGIPVSTGTISKLRKKIFDEEEMKAATKEQEDTPKPRAHKKHNLKVLQKKMRAFKKLLMKGNTVRSAQKKIKKRYGRMLSAYHVSTLAEEVSAKTSVPSEIALANKKSIQSASCDFDRREKEAEEDRAEVIGLCQNLLQRMNELGMASIFMNLSGDVKIERIVRDTVTLQFKI